jgi:hypothetical protein
VIAPPERLGDLTDLFNEPPERTINAAGPVAVTEGRGDLPLQDRNVHLSPRNNAGIGSKSA